MRRYLKKRLQNQIETMQEAHKAIRNMWSKGSGSCELWEDCQAAAIEVGTFIEKNEGEGTLAVNYLERYCENVYEMVQAELENKAKGTKKLIYRDLENNLNLAKEWIEKNITEEIEAVFLPYKASMWDSLESVWLAASKDENCRTYVIPIPYYDKNKDGTFGEMHYEIDSYPEYVPVVRYEEYSLEEQHPDMIFIHNPYDQYNKVTSVAPEFYASKLKEYTDELIYIPYFVSGEYVPEHFCVLPGTLYADKVILENEKVKETYLQEFRALAGKFDLQEKFLALGSPKYDKVVNKQTENIPPEWAKLIGDKKVILYNNTVGDLEEPQNAIRKIEDVLQVFKKQKNVVLLWRPHPLYYRSLTNIDAKLAEEYLEIVEKYKKDNYGIYDDTPELERAIRISDAYFGDGGSLPALYQKTGKPIMIQNLDILYMGDD